MTYALIIAIEQLCSVWELLNDVEVAAISALLLAAQRVTFVAIAAATHQLSAADVE